MSVIEVHLDSGDVYRGTDGVVAEGIAKLEGPIEIGKTRAGRFYRLGVLEHLEAISWPLHRIDSIRAVK